MILVVSNAILGNDPIKPKIVVRTASCTLGSAVAVNFAITSDGLILETTCMYGFFAKMSDDGVPSVPNNADDVAELLNFLPVLPAVNEVSAPDVVSNVGVTVGSLSSSSVSSCSSVCFSSSSVSKDNGKLVSLINSLARFKFSESGFRIGSKKSPKSPPPFLPSPSDGGGRSLPPPTDENNCVLNLLLLLFLLDDGVRRELHFDSDGDGE